MSLAVLEQSETLPAPPKRRGPRSPFGPKDLPNITLFLTARGQRLLSSAAARNKWTRSNILEYLLRKYAVKIGRDVIGKYRPKIRPNPCVSLTAEAKVLLAFASETAERTRSDVVEHLLDKYAAKLTRAELKIACDAA